MRVSVPGAGRHLLGQSSQSTVADKPTGFVEALGYGEFDTRGFELLRTADCVDSAAFVDGFGAAVSESLETDVMRLVCGAVAAPVPLVAQLRCWIDHHRLTAPVTAHALQEESWQP